MGIKARIAAVATSSLLTMGLAAVPAAAQPVVTGGLVNVTVVDLLDVEGNQVVVQAPIGVAANVCPNVNAAVLAQEFAQTGEADCEATTESIADSTAFNRLLG
jgi:hypothetical protein